jgi:hypothetical protein
VGVINKGETLAQLCSVIQTGWEVEESFSDLAFATTGQVFKQDFQRMALPSKLRIRPRDMCSITDEDQFGPVVNNCAHDFDFTLLFEEVFFSISLSAIFIVVIAVSFFYSRQQKVKLRTGWIVIGKLIAHVVHVLLQTIHLAFWALPINPKTHASLAAASLSTVVAIGLAYQSHREHFQNVRPSKTICLYFFFSLLLDIPRSRSLFMISGLKWVPIVFTICMGARTIVLVLEVIEKRPWILPQFLEKAPETTAGPFSRALLAWLNPLLFLGARRPLIMRDLLPVEELMAPDQAPHQFSSTKYERCRSLHPCWFQTLSQGPCLY